MIAPPPARGRRAVHGGGGGGGNASLRPRRLLCAIVLLLAPLLASVASKPTPTELSASPNIRGTGPKRVGESAGIAASAGRALQGGNDKDDKDNKDDKDAGKNGDDKDKDAANDDKNDKDNDKDGVDDEDKEVDGGSDAGGEDVPEVLGDCEDEFGDQYRFWNYEYDRYIFSKATSYILARAPGGADADEDFADLDVSPLSTARAEFIEELKKVDADGERPTPPYFPESYGFYPEATRASFAAAACQYRGDEDDDDYEDGEDFCPDQNLDDMPEELAVHVFHNFGEAEDGDVEGRREFAAGLCTAGIVEQWSDIVATVLDQYKSEGFIKVKDSGSGSGTGFDSEVLETCRDEVSQQRTLWLDEFATLIYTWATTELMDELRTGGSSTLDLSALEKVIVASQDDGDDQKLELRDAFLPPFDDLFATDAIQPFLFHACEYNSDEDLRGYCSANDGKNAASFGHPRSGLLERVRLPLQSIDGDGTKEQITSDLCIMVHEDWDVIRSIVERHYEGIMEEDYDPDRFMDVPFEFTMRVDESVPRPVVKHALKEEMRRLVVEQFSGGRRLQDDRGPGLIDVEISSMGQTDCATADESSSDVCYAVSSVLTVDPRSDDADPTLLEERVVGALTKDQASDAYFSYLDYAEDEDTSAVGDQPNGSPPTGTSNSNSASQQEGSSGDGNGGNIFIIIGSIIGACALVLLLGAGFVMHKRKGNHGGNVAKGQQEASSPKRKKKGGRSRRGTKSAQVGESHTVGESHSDANGHDGEKSPERDFNINIIPGISHGVKKSGGGNSPSQPSLSRMAAQSVKVKEQPTYTPDRKGNSTLETNGMVEGTPNKTDYPDIEMVLSDNFSLEGLSQHGTGDKSIDTDSDSSSDGDSSVDDTTQQSSVPSIDHNKSDVIESSRALSLGRMASLPENAQLDRGSNADNQQNGDPAAGSTIESFVNGVSTFFTSITQTNEGNPEGPELEVDDKNAREVGSPGSPDDGLETVSTYSSNNGKSVHSSLSDILSGSLTDTEGGSEDNVWAAVLDAASGDVYYYNKETNETTWDKPAALKENPKHVAVYPDTNAEESRKESKKTSQKLDKGSGKDTSAEIMSQAKSFRGKEDALRAKLQESTATNSESPFDEAVSDSSEGPKESPGLSKMSMANSHAYSTVGMQSRTTSHISQMTPKISNQNTNPSMQLAARTMSNMTAQVSNTTKHAGTRLAPLQENSTEYAMADRNQPLNSEVYTKSKSAKNSGLWEDDSISDLSGTVGSQASSIVEKRERLEDAIFKQDWNRAQSIATSLRRGAGNVSSIGGANRSRIVSAMKASQNHQPEWVQQQVAFLVAEEDWEGVQMVVDNMQKSVPAQAKPRSRGPRSRESKSRGSGPQFPHKSLGARSQLQYESSDDDSIGEATPSKYENFKRRGSKNNENVPNQARRSSRNQRRQFAA